MFELLVPLALAALPLAAAQSSCSASALSSRIPLPSLAPGFSARLVANGLNRPRSIKFDSEGRLLVVEQRTGVTAITFEGEGDCLSVRSKETLVSNDRLNHGLELSEDGRTLYASTPDVAYSWSYNPSGFSVSDQRELVTGMDNPDHSTRTLKLSRQVPDWLMISRGSGDNYDAGAASLDSGRSQIRAFNIEELDDNQTYDYTTQGTRIGWGLRNSVGIAEHPVTGGIYSVENSIDNAERLGEDVHEENPGEEMNFHGYLNGTSYSGQGQNYGYPNCFAAYNVSLLPENGAIQTGTQFALGTPNDSINDETCRDDYVAPRLTFPAHWAPLDMIFNEGGTMAYITSHGSWNRDSPDGYLVFGVEFGTNGEPTEPSNSTEAVIPIMANVDNSQCPDGCFRPVGLAFDSEGRLFVSADSSGEIYVITRTEGPSVYAADASAVTGSSGGGGESGEGGSGSGSGGEQSAAAKVQGAFVGSLMAVVIAMIVSFW